MNLQRTILLIDDDAEDAEIFLSALRELPQPVACTVISDARVALQQLISKALHPEIIFLDLRMPMMSGQDFLAEIQTHSDLVAIPIVVLSSWDRAKTIELTKGLGAKDFMTKTDSFFHIVQRLDEILTRYSPAEQ